MVSILRAPFTLLSLFPFILMNFREYAKELTKSVVGINHA